MRLTWPVRVSLLVSVALFSPHAKSATLDGYLAPVLSFSYPLSKYEYNVPTLIDSAPRIGFRLESGRLSDGISLDLRYGLRSRYADYGLMFRYFEQIGKDSMASILLGIGAGLTYSSGLTGQVENSFLDITLNPYVRFMFDTQYQFAFFAEAGYAGVVKRSFQTTPDKGMKHRLEVAGGMMFDFEEYEEVGFGGAPTGEGMRSKPVLWGIKGGLPITRVVGAEANESGTGVMVLGAVDAGGESLGLMAEAGYAQRKIEAVVLAQESSTTWNTALINLQARYRVGAPTYFYFGLGGYYSLGLGNVTVAVGGESAANDEVLAAPSDYGIGASVGIAIPGSIMTLTLEGRYNRGFKEQLGVAKTHAQSVDFLLGFLF